MRPDHLHTDLACLVGIAPVYGTTEYAGLSDEILCCCVTRLLLVR